jgi:hypothetical protein
VGTHPRRSFCQFTGATSEIGVPECRLYPRRTLDRILAHSCRNRLFQSRCRGSAKRHLMGRDSASVDPYLSIHCSLQRDILYRLSKDASGLTHAFDQAITHVRGVFPKKVSSKSLTLTAGLLTKNISRRSSIFKLHT